MPNLVLLGIQGSGKGTQADLLRQNYGFTHLNIGQLLREEMKKETKIGQEVRDYIQKGDLVPNNYVFTLIDPIVHHCVRGLILDGFPRTLQQAEFLEEKMPVRYAIYFRLDDETAKERLNHRRVCQYCKQNYNLLLNGDKIESNKCPKCGSSLNSRDDDNQKAINRRIEAFHQETKPVIDFYANKDKLITLDAKESPVTIHSKLVEFLRISNKAIS